jgi:hypothetical protein
MNIQGPLEPEALRILEGIPGVTVTHQPRTAAGQRTDATLSFAGTRRQVAVEIRQRVNAATAWLLGKEAERRPKMPLLLIAGETTADARRILKENRVAFLDRLGNGHIQLPGLLFHLEGRGRPQRGGAEKPPTRLRGKAGLAAQALLLHPERAWQVQDLANTAQVSVGLAHRVLARLEDERILTVEGTGPNRVRRLKDPAPLLELWAEENVDRPRRTLGYLLAPAPQQLIREIGALAWYKLRYGVG